VGDELSGATNEENADVVFFRMVTERCHKIPAKNDVVVPIIKIPTATCRVVDVLKRLNLLPIFL
jgi:hypothetical protein